MINLSAILKVFAICKYHSNYCLFNFFVAVLNKHIFQTSYYFSMFKIGITCPQTEGNYKNKYNKNEIFTK